MTIYKQPETRVAGKRCSKVNKEKTIAKSAKTGKFVSKAYEKKHKDTTIIQTVDNSDKRLAELMIRVETANRAIVIIHKALSDMTKALKNEIGAIAKALKGTRLRNK